MPADFGDQSEPILIQSEDDGVTCLRLNRPARLNALSEELIGALQAALDAIAADTRTRCVVIEGAGKAFCAGHDLAQMRQRPDEIYYGELFRACGRMMQSIVNLPVPVIAKVHGIATAAGCQLVASCDLAIASHAARLAVSGINVGLFCSTPAVALSRNVAPKNAFDMLVTGEFIDAEAAARMGLVNQAVEPSGLDEAVAAKARVIASKDSQSIRIGKALFHQQRQMALPDAYTLAATAMARNMMLPDTGEAIDAFVEKRAPALSLQPSK